MIALPEPPEQKLDADWRSPRAAKAPALYGADRSPAAARAEPAPDGPSAAGPEKPGPEKSGPGSMARDGRNSAATELASDSMDRVMMARCIALSRVAAGEGEYPFGTVIALDGHVVAEAINATNRDGDVSRHAEIIALSRAQRAIGRDQLRRCTLYSNIEPCAMCAYCIREAWVSRVVYALGSPVMGGLSKWNILRDDGMSDRIPEIFGAVPEVVSGVLLREAQEAWREWSPFAWEMIKLRGLMTAPSHQGGIRVQPAHSRSLWHSLQLLLMRSCQPRHRVRRAVSRSED